MSFKNKFNVCFCTFNTKKENNDNNIKINTSKRKTEQFFRQKDVVWKRIGIGWLSINIDTDTQRRDN